MRMLKHPGERGFVYFKEEGGNLSRSGVSTFSRVRFVSDCICVSDCIWLFRTPKLIDLNSVLNLDGGVDEAVASTVCTQNLYFIVSSATLFLEQHPRPLHRKRARAMGRATNQFPTYHFLKNIYCRALNTPSAASALLMSTNPSLHMSRPREGTQPKVK